MFCTGCGNKITETERFCKFCGYKNIYFSEGIQTELPAGPVETEAAQTESSKLQTNNVPVEEIIMPAEPTQVHLEVPEEKDETQEIQDIAVADAPEAFIEEESLIRAEVTVMPIEPVKEKVKQIKKGKKIGRMIGSVLLSIAAFIMTVVFVLAVFSKYILSEKVLFATTQKIDYSSMEIGDLLTGDSLNVEIYEGDTTLDIVYEVLQNEGRVDISKYELEEIFEEATFSEYISDKLAQYSRYALTGDIPEEITSEEIVRLVRENKKVIKKATGLEITSNDLEKMEVNLDTNEKELFDSLSVKEMDQTLKEHNLKGIQTLFSNQILILIMIFSFAALIGIIILISRMHKKVRALFSYVGIPILVVGLIIMVTMIVVYIFRENMFEVMGDIINVLEPVILSIITKGIITGAITTGVGLIMVICYRQPIK